MSARAAQLDFYAGGDFDLRVAVSLAPVCSNGYDPLIYMDDDPGNRGVVFVAVDPFRG